LPYVRFTLLPGPYLTDFVEKNERLFKCDLLKSILFEVYRYKTNPSVKGGKLNTRPRISRPLGLAFDKHFCAPGIEIINKRHVRCKDVSGHWNSVRLNTPIPKYGAFYCEFRIDEVGTMAIGLCTNAAVLYRELTATQEKIWLFCSSGQLLNGSLSSKQVYGEQWMNNDIIGMRSSSTAGKVIVEYSINQKSCGRAFEIPNDISYFPVVALNLKGAITCVSKVGPVKSILRTGFIPGTTVRPVTKKRKMVNK